MMKLDRTDGLSGLDEEDNLSGRLEGSAELLDRVSTDDGLS